MGAWAIVLVILAMKIPIFGLIWLVWWAGRVPGAEGPADRAQMELNPRLPESPLPLRPRRRGPHGGAARPVPRSAASAPAASAPARTRC